MEFMKLHEIDDWFQNARPSARKVYYKYKLGRDKSVAMQRLPKGDNDARATADFAWAMYITGRGTLTQKIVDGYCEYMITKTQ